MSSNRLFSAGLIFLTALFTATSHAGCDGLVGSGSQEAKPFIWLKTTTDEMLTGAIPDLAMVMARDMGIPMSVKYVGPWARAQNELKNANIDLLWGALRNKEREEYAEFIPTPLTRVRSVVLSRPDDTWQFAKLSDLEGRRGILTLGDSYGEEFDTYAAQRLTITRASKVDQAIKMVLAKRADYLVLDETVARQTLASMGRDVMRVSKTEASGQDLFLLISKKSLCNTPEMRDRLNAELLMHKKNKTIEKLLSNYWGR